MASADESDKPDYPQWTPAQQEAIRRALVQAASYVDTASIRANLVNDAAMKVTQDLLRATATSIEVHEVSARLAHIAEAVETVLRSVNDLQTRSVSVTAAAAASSATADVQTIRTVHARSIAVSSATADTQAIRHVNARVEATATSSAAVTTGSDITSPEDVSSPTDEQLVDMVTEVSDAIEGSSVEVDQGLRAVLRDLIALTVALRPDLSSSPEDQRILRVLVASTIASFLVMLLITYPTVFNAIGATGTILTLTKWLDDRSKRLVLPPPVAEDDEQNED